MSCAPRAGVRDDLRMLLLTPADVGARAWSRLERDGLLTRLTREYALPADISPSAHLRATTIARLVPARAAATGVAALWVYGLVDGPCPMPLRVAVERGRHPDRPVGTDAVQWQWHTDGPAYAAAFECAGVAVVPPAQAIATALRLEDLGIALAAATRAVRESLCTIAEIDDAIARVASGSAGRDRQLSAWRALQEALVGDAPSRGPGAWRL